MTEGAQFTFVDDAAGMAEFDPGRVKPVAVLKATGANVVVFAFDSETTLREHTAQYPALLQALEGTLTVTIGDDTFDLTPGDLLAHRTARVPQRDHCRPGPAATDRADDRLAGPVQGATVGYLACAGFTLTQVAASWRHVAVRGPGNRHTGTIAVSGATCEGWHPWQSAIGRSGSSFWAALP